MERDIYFVLDISGDSFGHERKKRRRRNEAWHWP